MTPRLRSRVGVRLHELAFNAIAEVVSVIGEDEVYRMVKAAWRAPAAVRKALAGLPRPAP